MVENSTHESLDPQISEMFDLLRPAPERKPEAVAENRKKFMDQLEAMTFPTAPATGWQRLIKYLGILQVQQKYLEVKEMFTRNLSQKSRVVVLTLAVLAVAFTVLFGGSTLTVMAAESAIPGDALYGVKTQFERTRINLSSSALVRAELQLQFAERRLEETKSLIQEGRFQNIKATTVLFENHINNALAELEIIAASDPAAAAELLNRITETLMRYTDLLGSMLSNIPEPVQADVQNALNVLQGISGSGNENVNLNANSNDDDDNVNDDMNSNDDDDNVNDDMNSNDDDDNVNDDMNSNDDDDDNVNDDMNSNDDDMNSNDDDDDNVNDNLNSNDDDDDNVNDNLNSNDDDDNVNDNLNSNDNDDNYNDNLNSNDNDDNDNDNDEDDDNDNSDDNDNDDNDNDYDDDGDD